MSGQSHVPTALAIEVETPSTMDQKAWWATKPVQTSWGRKILRCVRRDSNRGPSRPQPSHCTDYAVSAPVVCVKYPGYPLQNCSPTRQKVSTNSTNAKHVSYVMFNPLNPELNPICYLLSLLGAHHFLHVSRIRVKLLTFRLLMSYIYIWSTPFLMILDHTQRRSTVGRTPLDE